MAGCSTGRRPPSPPLPGTANLDALVRRHPGWQGVAQYDAALARLQTDAARLGQAASVPATLPPLPSLEASAPRVPAALAAGQAARLLQAEQAQGARLRQRRAQARTRQIALAREVWQREADTQYGHAAERAQFAYSRQARAVAARRQGERLNLTLQIHALERLVGGWKASVPPAPELKAAQAELAQKQARLAQLDLAQGIELHLAQAQRDAAVSQAQAARAAYVQAQAAGEEARLSAQDETQVRLLESRLAAQRMALLSEESKPLAGDVSPAGTLNAQAVPSAPVQAALSSASLSRSQASLQAARAHLEQQRTRWVAFLYDDTRSAALDAAHRRHWVLSFGPTRAGAADLTGPLSQDLAAHAWKT